MAILHYLSVLRQYWRLIAAFTVAGLVAAVGWVLLSNPVYESFAQVMVTVRAPETVGTQSVADQLSSDYLLTQEDVIKSRRVALRVVEKLRLADNAQVARALGWTTASGPRADFVAQAIGRGLRVGSSAVNSRVISIGYASNDARTSAEYANAFADAYADVSVDLQAEPARRNVDLYSRQMAELQAQMSAAQVALSQKQKELGIIATKGESDADTVRLDALSSQLAAMQAQNAAMGSRLGGGALPDALSNPVVQNLQSEVARLEGQRQQIGTSAGPNNPDYRQLTNQIDALRKQLRDHEALIRRSALVASAQARSTVASLDSAMAAQRRQVIRSRADKNQISVGEQDLANLQAVYDQIAARRSQLRILGDASQTNISILTPAIPDAAPAWPRPKLMIAAGILLGFLAGAMSVCGREFLDRRVRRSDELEKWLGIYDLGTIRSDRRSTQPPLLQRLKLIGFDRSAANAR